MGSRSKTIAYFQKVEELKQKKKMLLLIRDLKNRVLMFRNFPDIGFCVKTLRCLQSKERVYTYYDRM